MNTAGNIEPGSTGHTAPTATEVREGKSRSETLNRIRMNEPTSPGEVDSRLSDNSYPSFPPVQANYRPLVIRWWHRPITYIKPVDDYNHVYGDRAERTLAYINDAVDAGFSTGHITAVARSVLRGPRRINAFDWGFDDPAYHTAGIDISGYGEY